MPQELAGQVAVVAGATRGAGRGIARMLGAAGATVYCTGRSSRTQPNASDHHYAGRPETIEETAEQVTAAGGAGIAVRVDHASEAAVKQLFQRVKRERRRLDVVVNVLTGRPVASWSRFDKQSVAAGRAQFDSWVWPHVVTSRHAAPLMIAQKSGLMVEIIEQEGIGFHGTFFFDLFEATLKRVAFALAEELAPYHVTSVAVTPGFMRTEAILEQFGVTEANWRAACEQHAQAQQFGFHESETPNFVGRAIAALAADPQRAQLSGGVYSSYTLSQRYGFTDVDGRVPNIYPLAERQLAALGARPRAAVQWRLGSPTTGVAAESGVPQAV
ncbi:MAG TPA: SDR family NAD(P)-dependent oxidoreductase [Longimicrobiales bacterium]|nr:SDR family NAD(P)-dependent oxidoreductase [Longimicrobiales bacterium]